MKNKIYFGHFLSQFDGFILNMAIPFASIKKTDFFGLRFFEAYGFVPFTAFMKLMGGVLFGFYILNSGAKYVFRLTMFGMGFIAILFGVLSFLTIESMYFIPLGITSIGLFKFLLAAEKASSLYLVIDRKEKSLENSTLYYQIATCSGVLLAAFLFYKFSLEKLTSYAPWIYAAVGIMFLVNFKGKNHEFIKSEKTSIKVKDYLKMICSNYRIVVQIGILFGIDQFTYLMAMSLSTAIYYCNHVMTTQIEEINLIFICIDLLLLPVFSKISRKFQAFQFLKINLFLFISILPFCLLALKSCSMQTFFLIRLILVFIGLGYSFSLLNYLKFYLRQNVLFIVFISKAIGTLIFTSTFLKMIIESTENSKIIWMFMIPWIFLSLGIMALYSFNKDVLHDCATSQT